MLLQPKIEKQVILMNIQKYGKKLATIIIVPYAKSYDNKKSVINTGTGCHAI